MSAAESPLDEALREHKAAQAAEQAAAQRMTEPAPADPVLGALFADFARRMAGRTALVFVSVQPVTGIIHHRTGFLGRTVRSEKTRRVVTREVGRGWIVLTGRQFTLTHEPESHMSGSVTVEATVSLAITINGEPLIVAATQDGGTIYGALPVPDHYDHRPYVGPPLGPSLRKAIMSELRLDPVNWKDVEKEHYIPNPNSTGWLRAKTNGHEELVKRISEGMAALLLG